MYKALPHRNWATPKSITCIASIATCQILRPTSGVRNTTCFSDNHHSTGVTNACRHAVWGRKSPQGLLSSKRSALQRKHGRADELKWLKAR
eukprot:8763842-Lingulodinium_polyedra.AAC.1